MGAKLKYLLDTHAFLWGYTDDTRLSRRCKALLVAASAAELAISDVSLSEIARLLVAGRFQAKISPELLMQGIGRAVTVLSVTPAIALHAAKLDWENQDPIDRHIVSTALAHDVPVMTVDRKIHELAPKIGLRVIW
ncbi:MAG TPA: type II toxin-antitoxin system VapC family toxin [Opitutaceae bacterium]|jgi:PIN domain nuclease of toxin-antitoxin system|nr:type II toxin-antitoxin system VapC family toxin [Opitutaceae bacterium]